MQVVFFRHGEAEDAGLLGDDEIRCLTEKGRKRTKRTGKMMCKLMPGKCRVQIWSSPLIRTVQTAEILADKVGVRFQLEESLANGDFDSLIKKLGSCHKDDCVILVGHQPLLGDWVEKLTGARLPFRKSSAAGVGYEIQTDEDGGTTELLWYIQPNYVTK